MEWKNIIANYFPPLIGTHHDNLKTIPSLIINAPFAIYIVWDIREDRLTLIPHNRELTSEGRPDLFMVTLTSNSRDILNPGPPHVKNYLKGDAICVTTLKRRWDAQDQDFLESYEEILNPDSHKFWLVDDFYLIKRKIIENCLVTNINREKSNFWRHMCIADGFNTLCKAPEGFFPEQDKKMPEKIFYGKIFIPYLQPESFLTGTSREEKNLHIFNKTKSYCPGYHVYPSIMKLSEIGAELQQKLQYAVSPFHYMPQGDSKIPSILFTSEHFGLSGKLAMENSDRDLGFYPTRVSRVGPKRGSQVVKFTLKGSASESRWVELTKFLMNFKGAVFEMEVESSKKSKDNRLHVTARSVSKNPKVKDEILKTLGKTVVIYQEIQNNLHHMRNFPKLEEFEAIQWDSNFGKCLKALLGGEKRIQEYTNDSGAHQELQLREMLTDEQKAYADAMTHGKSPGLAVDSCFRGGKTFAIVVTANLLAIGYQTPPTGYDISKFSSYDHKKPTEILSEQLRNLQIHLALSNTNIAVTTLAFAHLRLPDRARAVRLITQSGYQKADVKTHTDIDYPSLYPKILKDHVMSVDAKVYEEEKSDNGCNYQIEQDEVTVSAFHHIKKALKRQDFKSQIFQKHFERLQSEKPTLKLFDTFIAIYKPQIIFATHSAITEALCNKTLENIKTHITTIQFDEAHRLPFFSLMSLGLQIPNARYSFIGDSRSLPSFSEPALPPALWHYSIRNVHEDAMRKFPSFKFTKCFDTHPTLVENCNQHFYSNKICSMRVPDDGRLCDSLRNFVGNDFPIQILDFSELNDNKPENTYKQSGNSLYSNQEAHLAVALVKKIQKQFPGTSIGILTFYKAQCGLVSRIPGIRDVFIGTIDCSQDHNFDITVILTTRMTSFNDSKFLEDPKRLSVAFSRAKEACFVIVDKGQARRSDTWRTMLNWFPEEEAFRDAITFIGSSGDKEEEEQKGVVSRKRQYPGPRPVFR